MKVLVNRSCYLKYEMFLGWIRLCNENKPCFLSSFRLVTWRKFVFLFLSVHGSNDGS